MRCSLAEYRLNHPIRFGDCDPAGILYYPRFFDLFHQTMEQWFTDVLEVPYSGVLRTRKIGLPTVLATCTYRAPLEFGDVAEVRLRLTKLGDKSLEFLFLVYGGDGGIRAEGSVTTVWMDLDPSHATFRRAISPPEDLRDAISRFRDA